MEVTGMERSGSNSSEGKRRILDDLELKSEKPDLTWFGHVHRRDGENIRRMMRFEMAVKLVGEGEKDADDGVQCTQIIGCETPQPFSLFGAILPLMSHRILSSVPTILFSPFMYISSSIIAKLVFPFNQ